MIRTNTKLWSNAGAIYTLMDLLQPVSNQLSNDE